MIATLTAFRKDGSVSHRDTRDYADPSLLWEHIGCQQNNRGTVRVRVETEARVSYEVVFPPWTAGRRYSPSRRFNRLLKAWGDEHMETE